MLQIFVHTALGYLREFAEVAVLGFFVAGILNAIVNKAAVARHLGGSVAGANALAATWGFLMPLCCCSGIPAALTLYRSGSHRGPACAFLIAVPWFNWYGLTALIIFLGWRAGLIVSLSAVTVGFVAGILIDTIVGRSPRVSAKPVLPVAGGCNDAGCCDTGGADPARWPLLDVSNPKEKVRSGVGFAVDLLRELGPWMIGGILLGAAIEAIVPKELVTAYLGKASLLGVLVALVIAGAFYTDSLASLPWVRTLLDKGLGAGSGMILLVAGVGTNLSTLGPVARVMGLRTAVVYAASVVALSGILGYLLNRLL
jgi:uncharacterized membrane protein YraQ (UPF0718 family)